MVAKLTPRVFTVIFDNKVDSSLEKLSHTHGWTTISNSSIDSILPSLHLTNAHVVVVDMSDPLEQPVRFIQSLRSIESPPLLIAVSHSSNPHHERTARSAGAHAYFALDLQNIFLNQAIEAIASFTHEAIQYVSNRTDSKRFVELPASRVETSLGLNLRLQQSGMNQPQSTQCSRQGRS